MAAIDFPNSPTVGDLFTAGNSSYRWTGLAWVSNNLGQIAWDDVTDKPTTFTPSAHTHATTDVTGLETYVDGRVQLIVDAAPAALDTLNELAAAIGDDANFAGTVTTALAGKAPTVHTHVKTDITDFAHTHPTSEVTGLDTALAGKANTVHTHVTSDVTGLDTSLASKVEKINGTVTTASTSSTVVRNITLSTTDPSGGADGDVWLKYTA